MLSNKPNAFPPPASRTMSNGSRYRRPARRSASHPKARHLYVDGGKTIQGFLDAGPIDETNHYGVPI